MNKFTIEGEPLYAKFKLGDLGEIELAGLRQYERGQWAVDQQTDLIETPDVVGESIGVEIPDVGFIRTRRIYLRKPGTEKLTRMPHKHSIEEDVLKEKRAARSIYHKRVNGRDELVKMPEVPVWRLRVLAQNFEIVDMLDTAQIETSAKDLPFRSDRLWTWIAPQQKPANIPRSDFFTRGILLLMKR